MTWQTNSTSLDSTEQLAEQVGSRLRGGEVIELVSDLGGGKTAFVRGLAKGMGSTDHVASPTFTISKEYDAGRLRLHHFDFYRLSEPGIIVTELAEVLDDPSAVVAIEWGESVRGVLPDDRLTVRLQPTSETSRTLTCTYPKSLDYLLPEPRI